MKVYQKNAQVVVDTEIVSAELQYIPIHNAKFVFTASSVKIFDYTDEHESSFTTTIAGLKDESGSLIGTKSQAAEYLSVFIGSPQLSNSNIVTHIELTDPADVSYSDFKELSFVCSGTIDVTINGVTIMYPKTLGTSPILGESLKSDVTSFYSVNFNGTGTVLLTQQK
jgi:hypothetical protein|tara:strand:- start:602 stop:1105 length:504 start_codon:yes stop_codon:yes gene_type:complete